MTLSIARRYPTDRSVVPTLRGGLDWAGGADLRTAISVAAGRHPRPSTIVVDLSAVTTFIDEIGVGPLVVGNRIGRQVGVELVVGSPSPLVRRLLGMQSGERLLRRNAPPHGMAQTRVRVRSPGSG